MKTIVILGAGIAATPLIRQVMKDIVLKTKDYKMIVVAPNSHFHWAVAMPRVVVPGQFADDKAMIALAPFFRDYPAGQFEFVLGTAGGLEPVNNTVTVTLNSGGSRAISYHTLVIATGTTSKDNMPWKVLGTTEETKKRVQSLRCEIEEAKTIVVAGGGQTGSETAGELGYEYSKQGRKEVYFIYNDHLPLAPPVLDSVRKQTKTDLEKLKVKLIPNTAVTSVTNSGKDTVLQLRDKDGNTKTLTTQAYLPTTGATPNSSFAPPHMLDDQGYFEQTTYLQAKGYSDIFVLGDVGNLEGSKAGVADTQAVHLIQALPLYLGGGQMPEYSPGTKEIAFITLGRSRGTGQMGSFKVFSFLVWFAKGRFLGTNYAHLIAAGKKTLRTTFEK